MQSGIYYTVYDVPGCKFLYGPFTSTKIPVQNPDNICCHVDGDIDNGSSILGDRSCSHRNITGSLVVGSGNFPNFNQLISVGQDIKMYGIRRTNGSENVSSDISIRFTMDSIISIAEVTYTYIDPAMQRYNYKSCDLHIREATGPSGSWSTVKSSWWSARTWPSKQSFNSLCALLDLGDVDALRALCTTSRRERSDYFVPYIATDVPVSYTGERIKSILLKQFLVPSSVGDIPHVFADITHNAVQDCQYVDVNGLGIVADLMKIKQLLPPLPLSKKELISPKYYASLFLWFQYGFMNTYRDVKSVTTAARKQIPNSGDRFYHTLRASKVDVCQKAGFNIRREYHVKIRYSRYDNRLMEVISGLDEVGFYPNLERSWDLVPFSFCVDWFVNIGGLLSRLDDFTRYQYLDVWCVTKSRKHSYLLPINNIIDGYKVVGVVEMADYERIVQRELDLPPVQIPPTNGFSNYAEATALVLVNVKK